MSNLQEVYASSQLLMNKAAANQQRTEDFIRALRFIYSVSSDTPQIFIDGFQDLIEQIEILRRIAVSYHQAIGESLVP